MDKDVHNYEEGINEDRCKQKADIASALIGKLRRVSTRMCGMRSYNYRKRRCT